MACAANYIWSDPRDRSAHGLRGGDSLARLHICGGRIGLSAFDEKNAFTRVEIPEWMWAWCSTPPVVAQRVWHLLPEDLRATLRPQDWVSAQYRRMAIGSTHSVHSLMCINITVVGRMMRRSWTFVTAF